MTFLQHLTEVKSMTDAIKSKLMNNKMNVSAMEKSIQIIDGLSTLQKDMFEDRFEVDLNNELSNMKNAMKFMKNCELHKLK